MSYSVLSKNIIFSEFIVEKLRSTIIKKKGMLLSKREVGLSARGNSGKEITSSVGIGPKNIVCKLFCDSQKRMDLYWTDFHTRARQDFSINGTTERIMRTSKRKRSD